MKREKCLSNAINVVIRRHPGLHTALQQQDASWRIERDVRLNLFVRSGALIPGLYRQRIVTPVDISLTIRSVAVSKEDDLANALEVDLSSPFDYESPPFLRATLFVTDMADEILVIVASRLVMDRESAHVFTREVLDVYQSSLCGPACIGPTQLSMHFPAYAAWQLQKWSTGALDEDFDCWQKKWTLLESAQPRYEEFRTSLPADQHRSLSAALTSMQLDQGLDVKIRSLDAQVDDSVECLFLAAIGLLIRKCTGREHVAVWIRCRNRRYQQTANAIGWFANAHIIGIDMRTESTAASLCAQVSRGLADARRHEELPVGAVWSKMGRRVEHDDLRIVCDYRTIDESSVSYHQIARQLSLSSTYDRPGLNFVLWKGPVSSSVDLRYLTERFEHGSMEQLLKHVGGIMSRIAYTPESPLSSLT